MKQLRASVLALLRIKAFAKDKDGKVFFYGGANSQNETIQR